jgi:hypothetical protein
MSPPPSSTRPASPGCRSAPTCLRAPSSAISARKQQENAKGGWYARKSAHSFAQRRVLGAFVLLQDGEPAAVTAKPTEAERNAANVKAASYFLGVDAVGISRCPDWTWYSHDATGAELIPPHDQAISMIIDQGYETMDGASAMTGSGSLSRCAPICASRCSAA